MSKSYLEIALNWVVDTVLESADPLLRADERNKIRTKVETLEHDSRCGENRPKDIPWEGYCDCWKKELLDYLDEIK